MAEADYTVRISGEGRGLQGTLEATERDLRELRGEFSNVSRETQDTTRATERYGRQANNARQEAQSLRNTLSRMGRDVNRLRQRFSTLQNIAVGAFTAIAGGLSVKQIFENTIRQEEAMQQLEQRLVSTRGAAGLTANELFDFASSLQQVTTFGDEAVIEMEALLLTFTNIRGDIFKEATRSILDMSIAMDQGLKQSAIQLGKALNDPAEGLTALSRVGVRFTESQEETIKSLIETGEIAKAQKLILQELQTEFGGAATAARDTLGGAIKSLQNAFGDLLEADKGGLVQVKAQIEALTKALSDPAVIDAADRLTRSIFEGFRLAAKGVAFFGDVIHGLKLLFKALEIGAQQMRLQILSELHKLVTPLRKISEFFGREHQLSIDIETDILESKRNIASLRQELIDLSNATKPSEKLNTFLEEVDKNLRKTSESASEAGEKTGETQEEVSQLTEEFDRLTRATRAYIEENVMAKLRTEAMKEEIGLTVFELVDLNREMGENEQLTTLTTDEMLRLSGVLETTSGRIGLTTEEVLIMSGALRESADAAEESSDRTERALIRVPDIAQEAARGLQRSFSATFRDIFDEGIDGFSGFFSRIGDLFKNLMAELLAAFAASGLIQLLGGRGGLDIGGFLPGGGSGSPSIPLSGFGFGEGGLFTTGGASSMLQNLGLDPILSEQIAGFAPALGAASLGFAGGGLASNLLGLNQTGGSVGGGLGAGLGMMLGATGAIGGPLGALLGGTLGTLAGGFLGDLFTDDPRARVQLKTAETAEGFKNNAAVRGPFGFVGPGEAGTRSLRKVEEGAPQRFAQTVADVDAQVAQFLTESQIEGVTTALRESDPRVEDVGKKLHETEFGRILADRAITIIEAVDEEVPQVLREAVAGANLKPEEVRDILVKSVLPAMEGLSEEARQLIRDFEGSGDEAIQFTKKVVNIQESLKSLNELATNITDNLIPENLTLTESFERQNEAFMEFIHTTELTPQAIDQAGQALINLRQTAQQVFVAIEQARNQIGASTQSAKDQITLSGLDKEGQFNFFRERAQSLREGLSELDDPALISQRLQQINQLTLRAFGLLDPEQQRQLGPQFTEFLEQAEEDAQDRLDEIGEEVKANLEKAGDAIVEKFGTAIEPFLRGAEKIDKASSNMNAAATNMNVAADKMNVAANTPQQVTVSIDSEESAVGF